MYIEKNNLLIRSAVNDDAEILTSWWNDGKIMAHAGFSNGLKTNKEDVLTQISNNLKGLSQRCIIEISNERIGECSYRLKDDYAEIGIKICDTNFQNKGYGTKLLKIVINFIFTDKSINNTCKINRVILDTDLENVRAQYVYEKLGFKKIRTNIDSWKNQLGVSRSSIDYELTLEDYKKLQY